MVKKMRLFIASALMMIAAAASAQVTTSAMAGQVSDTAGDDVIGATIRVTHEPSGTTYNAVTNADGRWAIQGMRVGGPYTVKISYIGYGEKDYKGIRLALGETYNLNATMAEDVNELGEVVVVGSASKFSNEKTGATTNISNAQIQALPTVNRSIEDIARLSPYANGMSFAGGDGRSTNFTLDGANLNNNFGLNDGLPGGGNPISMDAIDEVQVVIAPFDVRQTNFIGGGINAVTKSGTNTFRGTAYVYHTNENMHLMRDILRGEWGYDKVVVTDWAGSNDRIQGVIAGNELEMPGCKYGIDDVVKALTEGYEIPEYVQEYPEQYNAVLKGIKEGKLDEKLVDEALDRLLDLILETDKAIKQAPKQFNTEEHHLFAQKCAEECMVLLKNEKGVLPLTEKEKVCIIGDFAENPRYQGAGSSVVNPTKVDNVLDCVAEYPIRFIGYTKGYERYGKKSGKLEKYALKLAEEADKIVFFAGLDEVSEAEGIDRRDMKLPANQLEVLSKLLALGKPVVVVLCCGSAVELDVIDDADAIVHAYLSGQAGARAILGVLSGKVNPSGKLAESYPVRYEDCSSAARFPGKAASVEYREALYVGYRYYDTAGVAVRYPFGFGLSYTKFEYSAIKADEKGVTFTLKNAGEKDGAEVAQLYIGKKDGKVFRPAKELKGFAKVFLKAGESKNVFIPFDKYTFRYYNVNTKAWEEEPGAYQVMVGASSADIRLNAEVTRAGTKAACPYDKAKLPSYYSGKAEDVNKEEYEALLGKPLPRAGYRFYKKRRMVIDENATVADLRFSRRWVGRLFSAVIRFAHSFLWAIGQKTTANTIMMGMYHQPVRGLAKYGGMSRKQMEALLMMFNGHLFKGIGQFFSKADKPKAENDKA